MTILQGHNYNLHAQQPPHHTRSQREDRDGNASQFCSIQQTDENIGGLQAEGVSVHEGPMVEGYGLHDLHVAYQHRHQVLQTASDREVPCNSAAGK